MGAAMRQVVLISGHICTGKSELAKRLGAQFGYHVVKTSDVLKGIAKARSKPIDRVSLQKLGDILDSETDHQWLLDEVLKGMQRLSTRKPIVVDSVRTWRQLQHFRTFHGFSVVHAHLWAPKTVLEQRYQKKNAEGPEEANQSYTEADLIKNEADIASFKNDADVRINTARTDSADIVFIMPLIRTTRTTTSGSSY
jgi:adenylosuccinate synthase